MCEPWNAFLTPAFVIFFNYCNFNKSSWLAISNWRRNLQNHCFVHWESFFFAFYLFTRLFDLAVGFCSNFLIACNRTCVTITFQTSCGFFLFLCPLRVFVFERNHPILCLHGCYFQKKIVKYLLPANRRVFFFLI